MVSTKTARAIRNAEWAVACMDDVLCERGPLALWREGDALLEEGTLLLMAVTEGNPPSTAALVRWTRRASDWLVKAEEAEEAFPTLWDYAPGAFALDGAR